MHALGEGRGNRAEFISLAQLVREAPVYERLPQPLRAGLRQSVWWTLVTQVALLVFLIFVQPRIGMVFVQPEGFFLGPSADIANSILMFGYRAMPWLIILNLANLFLTLAVLTLSLWMMQGVREPVHWLAAANAIPAGINMVLSGLFFGALAFIIVVLVIIWIILIVISIAVCIGVLSALLSR
jgi:hypothetical protein